MLLSFRVEAKRNSIKTEEEPVLIQHMGCAKPTNKFDKVFGYVSLM